jgi:hypothetical protein
MGSFLEPNSNLGSFTGRLARTKNSIELTSSPILKEIEPAFDFPGVPKTFDYLHGFTTEGPCTVYYLHSSHPAGLTDFSAGHSIIFRSYRVSLCVFGLHLPSFEAPFTGSVAFSYSGLHQWISLRTRISETGELVITNSPNYPAIFDVCSRIAECRMMLEIVPLLQHRSSGEYESRHESRLLIEPSQPQSLDWYLQLGYRLEHVFSLLLGTSVALKTVAIEHENKTGWLVRRRNHKTEKADPAAWIKCDHTQLTHAILTWLDMPEQFRSLERLIYGTIRQSSLFVETEFLSLAQALESFHRVTNASTVCNSDVFRQVLRELQSTIARCCASEELAGRLNDSIRNANEPSFKSRIIQLLHRLPEEHRKKLIGDEAEFEMMLRQTRNHFTHPGIEKKSKVLIDSSSLFLFNQKLHGLLRFLMLTHIGLPAEQIFEPVLRQATKWH